jgi:hypothetical protein
MKLVDRGRGPWQTVRMIEAEDYLASVFDFDLDLAVSSALER